MASAPGPTDEHREHGGHGEPRDALRGARFPRAAPLFAAGVVAVLLVGGALVMKLQIADASDAVVRGQADAFASAARELSRAGPVDDAALTRFLDEQRDAGLRYVGVFPAHAAHAEGAPAVASAGAPRGTSFALGPPAAVDGRFRLVRPLPAPNGSRAAGRELVVLELEPSVAHQLDADARNVLLLACITAACVVALAFALSRAWLAHTRLLADLAASRHLAALGEMSAVIAHEVKNPLASLKGHAQLLEEQLEEGTRPRQKAELVVREAVRLENLVKELLTFARTGLVERAPVDASALARAVVDDAPPAVLEARAAPVLAGDEGLLRQALANVVRNAVQVSPEGAPPVVEVLSDEDHAVFIVRDRGPGIAPDDLPRLFEPFFTKKTRGTGLGLAVARRIVELHGGTITAENGAGGGAVFRIAIPAMKPAMKPAMTGGR